ncbi:Trk K+ transport system NAD-binding subunit [Arenicella xantha]|uniref:Trk K+ transport system NAD-binding subunit n=2 Tax=Arenicella xantha TaxID=644221 RepID=A0A395JF01_9GAMM|nr:Trk K+ transport system NAD-binding subunit [Arenicella xantha]
MPGIDPNGDTWHMSFFHAFYFVSFMGTTIGFGEIPYPFTDAQRAWVLGCIYTSVIAWLYGIGSLLRLVQDETFRYAVSERNFRVSINRIDQPFYIICGYGETGELITQGLADMGIQTVVIDIDPERTNAIELNNLSIPPIVLNADIKEPKNLTSAGIKGGWCRGVIAVTQNDHVNLKVAVACKLIKPDVPVICRSEIEDEAANMESFGTNFIVNPYLTFARRINLLTQNPGLHRIQNWFINQHSEEHLHQSVAQSGLPKGRWLVCGYGRFGRAVTQALADIEVEITVVDPDPIASRAPKGTIVGRGTEAKTLREAGIDDATVVVAASDDDANNLSILITAKQINKNVVTIGRVSHESDQMLFEQARCDYIFRRSLVVANEVLTLISRPLVTRFIQYSYTLTKSATEELIAQICQLTGNKSPVTWRLAVRADRSPALTSHLQAGGALNVEDLCRHQRIPRANAIPLLLWRDNISHLMPSPDMPVQENDEILFCARRNTDLLAQRLCDNEELVDTLINGNEHSIPLIRWLSRKVQH